MKLTLGRALVLIAAGAFVFLSVALLLLQFIPGPHKSTDYVVIGTLATFATLVTLFFVLINTYGKGSVFFQKRRKKENGTIP